MPAVVAEHDAHGELPPDDVAVAGLTGPVPNAEQVTRLAAGEALVRRRLQQLTGLPGGDAIRSRERVRPLHRADEYGAAAEGVFSPVRHGVKAPQVAASESEYNAGGPPGSGGPPNSHGARR